MKKIPHWKRRKDIWTKTPIFDNFCEVPCVFFFFAPGVAPKNWLPENLALIDWSKFTWTRRAPTRKKEFKTPYKWVYTWITGVINPHNWRYGSQAYSLFRVPRLVGGCDVLWMRFRFRQPVLLASCGPSQHHEHLINRRKATMDLVKL